MILKYFLRKFSLVIFFIVCANHATGTEGGIFVLWFGEFKEKKYYLDVLLMFSGSSLLVFFPLCRMNGLILGEKKQVPYCLFS
jgi:hypothetical protein